MRFVQFRPVSAPAVEPRLGVLLSDGKLVADLRAALIARGALVPSTSNAFWDKDGVIGQAVAALAREAAANPDAWRKAGHLVEASSVKLAAPIPRPGKVICIGLNYRDHAIESNMPIPETPIVFSKFATSICGPDDAVPVPVGSTQTDYEAELAVIIGRYAKGVTKERAMDYVFGYACMNDVSARDFQFADKQWQRGKSCDNFGPLGPFVATADEIKDPHALGIRFRLNGETLQNSSTNQLIFRIPELIEWLSRGITLEPGDVIATGTPPGVGFARKPPVFLKEGDRMEVEIDGLGVLANPVVQAR